MANPLKSIMNIKRDELPLSLLMFGYFFLVITSFWILKPLKKGLFIEYYDLTGFTLLSWQMTASQAELLAKVLNMVVAFFAVAVFSWLNHRFYRQQLTYIFSGFFMVCYVLYSFIINSPADITVWTFYLFGDLFTTLMVATFFAFLNDSVSPEKAKRLYGLIVLGGVTGGVFGSMFVRVWIESVPLSDWLYICFGIAAGISLIAMFAGRLVEKNPPRYTASSTTGEPQQKGGNPAFEGAKLVFRSSYLIAIVSIVGLYEIVSTIMDFQFTATIAHYLDGPAIGKQFSTVYTFTNIVSMCVQLFLTSFIMTRFGVKTALLILPIAIISSSFGFMVVPILWMGSLLNTADNGFAYSINQSAKEALYVPTSRHEKYRAKAFIDMFIQRFAKAIAVVVSLIITSIFADFNSMRWLSIITIVVVAVWIYAAIFAGRRFREMAES
ncbi:MAG: MFS transporter [candidate division Zixibacteria bacterium]|nr:MFS transporter [candidate division Zixibacteria bacterium]